MATSDDKNQRRARRVSAKIKNNESSDLEVTNVGKGQDLQTKGQGSNSRGISA